MKPSDLATTLRLVIRAKQPTFVWGPPGIGKSQIVQQTAASENLALIDIRAVLLDPVDLRGLPAVNGDGRAHWAIPEFLPRDGSGVLFLDELNAAPALVQASCYQLILDRKLGEYTLPDGWMVLAAGNRESDGAVTHRMPSALRNRFVHLEAETDLDDWCKWALSANISPEVIAFLRFKPDLLHNFDKSARAFPTPRSWEFVDRIAKQQPGPAIEHALFSGTVGEGAAVEFSAFLRLYRELPSIDAILLDPQNSPVPTNPATCYAVATALARRTTNRTIGSAITYLDRMQPEYSVMSVRDMVAHDSNLQSSPEFTRWAVNHSDVIF